MWGQVMQGAIHTMKKAKQAHKPRAYPKPWRESEARFRTTFQECAKLKRGCKWCTQDRPTCCKNFEANLGRLRIWRDEMRSVSSSRHDAEALLIFGPGSINKSASSTQPNTKPSEDDEMSDSTQCTSQTGRGGQVAPSRIRGLA